MAAPLVAVIAVVAVVVALLSGPSVRAVASAGEADDGAGTRADFLELFERSRVSPWQAVFSYERIVDDEVGLSGTIVEVNVPPERVVTGIGGFTYQRGTELISCVDLDDVRECRQPEPARPIVEEAAREVDRLRARIDPDGGDLEVREVAEADVAGTPTRCFQVQFVDREIPGQTETCFDDAGIPLRFVLERPGTVDTRTATSFSAATPDDVALAIADYPVDVTPTPDSESLPALT